ncbi:MAG: hypothetical protein KF760_23415 [Candidatus Eremiobacteraeota bacterium]|nr:hypothetical protein [Candidatus Eremiobacteraeota bacterium]MCW5866174.1 hypothetical protein [Candidatus Eremiobacteraeota bacterium]
MRKMLIAALSLSTLAGADPVPGLNGWLSGISSDSPAGQVDVKIVREYEENGESKRAEFDGLPIPALQDENARQILTSMMKMFAAQAGPMLQGRPFQMILEVPSMKEKLNIEVNPRP